MSGGSKTISNITPAAGNLRIQTSVYGAAIAIVYGTTRVSGNLTWFGGFRAIPHTSTQSSGGKGGGGVKSETTTFTYEAAVLMSLGEGPFNTVVSAWRGKTRYSGLPASSVPTERTEVYTVPAGGLVQVAYGPQFLNSVSVQDQTPEPYDFAYAY